MSALRVSRLSLHKAMYQTDFVALILPVHEGDIQRLDFSRPDILIREARNTNHSPAIGLYGMSPSWLPAWGCINKMICCSSPSIILE